VNSVADPIGVAFLKPLAIFLEGKLKLLVGVSER
jgi:hypothetical protein